MKIMITNIKFQIFSLNPSFMFWDSIFSSSNFSNLMDSIVNFNFAKSCDILMMASFLDILGFLIFLIYLFLIQVYLGLLLFYLLHRQYSSNSFYELICDLRKTFNKNSFDFSFQTLVSNWQRLLSNFIKKERALLMLTILEHKNLLRYSTLVLLGIIIICFFLFADYVVS